MNFKPEYALLTHKGRTRKKNEDSIMVAEELNLAAVADGMGGHNAGDIASKTAVKTIKKIISDIEEGLVPNKSQKLDTSQNTDKLLFAVRQANRIILKKSEENPENKGMGTTLTAVMIAENRASIVHIGDSRIYLFRKNKLSQLTTDHSLVTEQLGKGVITKEEARNSAMQNILTKALGTHKHPCFDTVELTLFTGDILLLCSDGLFKPMSNKRISKILSQNGSARYLCRTLINTANAKGGPDNISAIVIKLNPLLTHKIKETVKRFFKS